MMAYEQIGIQQFYLTDLKKCHYYLDRSLRGKIEMKESKVRMLSALQYGRKLDLRVDDIRDSDEAIMRVNYDKVKPLVKSALRHVQKIQNRSKNNFYNIKDLLSLAQTSTGILLE
jgi:hypothetical protein